MKQVSKNEYREILKSGFNPKFPVTKTSHGRYKYLVESDYENYLRYSERKKARG